MGSSSIKPSYTAKAIDKLADAIFFHAFILMRGQNIMANNFEGLSAAIDAVAAGIEEVAAAIANPAVDNNDQETIDGLTARLGAAVEGLRGLKAAEDVEDGVAGETPVEETPETPAE